MANPSLSSRRAFLSSACVMRLLGGQTLDPTLSMQVFDAVWTGVRDQFYDPYTCGVDWLRIKSEFSSRVQRCTSRQQLLSVLREMLRRLQNSHISLYSRGEWDLRQNILPFCFDALGGRVFVRYEFSSKDPHVAKQFQFGDEILSIDGVEASRLRPLTLARLEEVYGNPNFGAPGSVAKVRIKRHERMSVIRAQRVARPSGFETAALEHPRPDIAHLRLFTLGSSELPPERLQHLWDQVCRSRGLILDFRNCVGGDSTVSNFLAGALLGAGKPLFCEIPRPGSTYNLVTDTSDAGVRRFGGRVAILTNFNTESEPEAFTAVCKEYKRARVFGERTAGALNGWTIAINLPEHFARFAVPYTCGVSPKGVEYEEIGVDPDEVIVNSADDFSANRDQPLVRAIQYVTVVGRA